MHELYQKKGDSRREFVKKGALAATVLLVGGGSVASTVGSAAAQERGEVVMNGLDYRDSRRKPTT